jgi:hypothetical protein
MSNNLKEDSIPEDFKRYLGSSLANGYYLDDDAREKQFEKIVERVGALINQKEKEAEIRGLENLLDGSAEGATCICESAGLSVCDHNWSLCNVVRDRIKQLKEELNKEVV